MFEAAWCGSMSFYKFVQYYYFSRLSLPILVIVFIFIL